MKPAPEDVSEKGPIAWMAGHSVAANLIMLFCLVGGFLSLRGIKKEVFPEIEMDEVVVTVAYPGASPEEIEQGIILAVEEAVRGLDNIDEIVSAANEGVGVVTIELTLGTNTQKAAQDIKSEIDRITTFPADAEEPDVRIASRKREVLNLSIYGDASTKVLHELGEQIRDHLLRDPEISQIDLTGVPPLEIGIEISQENLRRYGLTPGEVASVLRNASVDIPGGGLKTEAGEVLVRIKERRDTGREFAKIPVKTTPDGGRILLGDIAQIEDAFADADRYTRYNGKPAVSLEVYEVGRQSPIAVSDAVKRHMDEIRADLPPGIEIAIERDRSDIYRQRVELLLKNGGFGLLLVLLILGIFLEIRLAFWVMMGIPISFMGAFLIIPSAGVTINMISLFAFIIALGIVVDDAIVVGENVYHYHQEGMPFLKAAIRGARDVAMPVVFSILTNIVTFMPIYFIPGTMGKMFKMLPIVICTTFIISLIESVFVLPAHLGHQTDRRHRRLGAWLHEKQQTFSRRFRNWVQNGYGPFLGFTLAHRYVTVTVAAGSLAVMLSYALSGRMGFSLFPIIESDFSQVEVVLPYGTPVERTEAVMERFLKSAKEVHEETGRPELVESIVAEIGHSGGHTGRMRVQLAEPKIRDRIMSTSEFTRKWREKVGDVAGVEFLKFAADAGGPGGRGRPIAVELSHRDISIIEKAGRELAGILETYPLLSDIDNGFLPGKPQLDFTIKPEGKSLGLSAQSVARQVRDAFYGAEVVRQQRGRNEIKIMVRLPRSERATEQTVRDLMIRTPGGRYVPLREIAEYQRKRAYTVINRRDGRRVIQVSADITPRSKAGEVLADIRTGVMPRLQAKYPGLAFEFRGHEADMQESLASLKTSFVLAMLAVYALLAIPFRSYVQPLIVMVSIPFGIVGALLGHMLMGYDLCIPSMFGIVALSGVVVNDSLVLIDFANRSEREGGMSHYAAIYAAAIQRFRPVLLTTLTTFGGLAPMIFETSRQARFIIPMALSLGFGILLATGITLIIVPALYVVVREIKLMVTPAAKTSEADRRIAGPAFE